MPLAAGIACAAWLAPLLSPRDDGDAAASFSGSRKSEAVLVFQLRDCEGRLEFASLFGRERIRRGMTLRAVLAGLPSERDSAAAVLHRIAPGVPVSVAAPGEVARLSGAVRRPTPFVVVRDAAGGIRFVGEGPETPEQHVRLLRELNRLAS